MLGRKAKCPKCSHRFVLRVSGPGISPPLDDVPVLPLAPHAGTSARWVPDDAPAHAPAPSTVAEAAFPDFQVSPAETPSVDLAASAPSSVSGLRSRKPRRRNRTGLILAGAMALVVAGGLYAAFLFNPRTGDSAAQNAPKVNEQWEEQKAELLLSNETAEALSPTSGKRIPLDFIPFTPQLLCHLHPSELWSKSDRTLAEFQAMTGTIGIWLNELITHHTRFEPENIAELTLAVNFGARMSAPDIAAVVRLKQKINPSEMRERFSGRRRPDPDVEIYETDEISFLVIDPQTIVAAPASLTEELVLSRRDAALLPPSLETLVQASDRDRHLTLVLDLRILDSHREDLFREELQPVVDHVILWFGRDVETVSWSMHLTPNFFMETLLQNTSASSPLKVQRYAQLQLSRLGEQMLHGVRQMQPATEGTRQMIGRFPAMLHALDLGTTTHVAPNFARLVTVLPRHASTNLAAGALLTWNQSLLTTFSDDDTSLTKKDEMVIPDRLVDRLKLPVLVDFRRTPLQEAFAYIGDAIKTDVEINGDALKGAGFTQNMPQTLDLGKVPAQAAIHAILERYAQERDPLVLIVDEKAKKLILSTRAQCEADGLTPYDTSMK